VALQRITDDDVLAAVVELAGDGYCPVSDLIPSLPKRTHSVRRRAVSRAVNAGVLLERRGPDGRTWVAVATEGWRQLRAA
jgi:hypothetical protein